MVINGVVISSSNTGYGNIVIRNGNVVVKGDIGNSITTHNGNVNCGEVKGTVSTRNGSVIRL